MLNNRPLLIALIAIFVLVLLYNGLYFTGMIGGDPVQPAAQQTQEDPLLQNLPGLSAEGDSATQEPAPSGGSSRVDRRRSARQPEPPRQALTVSDLDLSARWGRNPFLTPSEIDLLSRPGGFRVAEPVDRDVQLHVTTIVTESTGRRVAVVNNQVVTIGDLVGGMEVAEIGERVVVFRGGDAERIVPLDEPEINLRSRQGTSGGGSRP